MKGLVMINREDIIRMAREAGYEVDLFGIGVWDSEEFNRFAALVAAAEREAILPMLKGIDSTETEDPDGWWETSAGADFGAGILAAIRARGETK